MTLQPLLVECYRKLRQGDAVGQNRSAYRITVRQLEAMIRLAEALARLHLDEQLRPRHHCLLTVGPARRGPSPNSVWNHPCRPEAAARNHHSCSVLGHHKEIAMHRFLSHYDITLQELVSGDH